MRIGRFQVLPLKQMRGPGVHLTKRVEAVSIRLEDRLDWLFPGQRRISDKQHDSSVGESSGPLLRVLLTESERIGIVRKLRSRLRK
jgi:hypothetical protein